MLDRADAPVTLPAIKTLAAITAANVRGRMRNPKVVFCEYNIEGPLKVLPPPAASETPDFFVAAGLILKLRPKIGKELLHDSDEISFDREGFVH